MSLDLELYKERLEAYKISGKSGKVNSIKKSIINNFYDNPAYFDVLINTAPRGVHLLTKKDSKGQNKLLCKPDENINIGDFVEWESNTYVCMDIENDNSVQCTGYITKCNNTLTFQTPDTTIHTIPCIITDRASVYSDGVEDTKYLSLPDGLIKIVVPNNTTTNTFNLLNKKLIFDHSKDSVYKVTKVGKVLKQGLIEIIAEVQVCDPNTDNLELNLSNYIDTTEPEIPEIPPEIPDERNYEVILYGQDVIPIMQTGNYNVRTFDNGIETGHEVRFEINNTSLANIKSQDGRNCVVATNTNFSMGEVKLKVILLVDEAVFVEKTIGITGF
ncbi:MAG: hypothetical protein PHT02_10155 [Tissierellia bacterium]|nr:hypothetical protein [Tissierellia bacterium]